jgi:hypothetical protein
MLDTFLDRVAAGTHRLSHSRRLARMRPRSKRRGDPDTTHTSILGRARGSRASNIIQCILINYINYIKFNKGNVAVANIDPSQRVGPRGRREKYLTRASPMALLFHRLSDVCCAILARLGAYIIEDSAVPGGGWQADSSRSCRWASRCSLCPWDRNWTRSRPWRTFRCLRRTRMALVSLGSHPRKRKCARQ